MLKNTTTKRPKVQFTIHNLLVVFLPTIQRVKKIKWTYVWSATHQADTESKTNNQWQDLTCDSEQTKQNWTLSE